MIIVKEVFHDDGEGAAYRISLTRDGKILHKVEAKDFIECPEDAMLGRDLDYAYDFKDFFEAGYQAGLAKEEVQFIKKEINDSEEFWEEDE